MSRQKLLGVAFIAAVLAGLLNGGAQARDQWSINHGMTNPPVDPRFAPGGAWSGYVPKFNGDFWKGQLANKIPAGTVLTAILEDDLSSAKNKKGDTFTLTLQDGFILNDKQLIPPNSKIIGAVTAAMPAKMQKGGLPGQLDVSLQSVVFPDGRHVPIFALIDSNPNHAQKQPAKVRHLGAAIQDYGESLGAMAFSFVSGPGFMMRKLNRGLDFKLDKGEALPIRLNRSLEIPQSESNSVIAQPAGTAGGIGLPYPPNTQQFVPGLVDPQGPVVIPPTQQGMVAPHVAPPIAARPNVPSQDPNAVFNQPIQPNSLNQMADPF